MALNRFFGRSRAAAPPPVPDELDATDPATADDAAVPESDGEPEGDPEAVTDRSWGERARAVLPTGASTGSKRREALYGSADAAGPTHFASASGCRVVDAPG